MFFYFVYFPLYLPQYIYKTLLMAYHSKIVIETDSSFIINGIKIPKMKATRLNIYNSTQIKAVGIETFLDLVCEKEPIAPPDLGFTDKEWDEMEKHLG